MSSHEIRHITLRKKEKKGGEENDEHGFFFTHTYTHRGRRGGKKLTILLVCIPLSLSFSSAAPYTVKDFSPFSWMVSIDAIFPQR